jgi:D-amino peptidase
METAMKIMMMTDMEGVAGVLDFEDWAHKTGRYHDKAKRLLTEEVNAAVDGLCAGGATEIIVRDGHGPGGIDPEILDERASFSRGHADQVWPWGLDRTYDGLCFIGQHAKAGTDYSHLTHTQGTRYIDLSINDLSVGEYGQLALCAMELGVPTFFATGEEALAREAEALTPGVVTVAVKRGLLKDGLDGLDRDAYAKAKLSALHVAPARSRKMIRDGARKAVKKLKSDRASFGYPKLSSPYVRVARFRAAGDQPAYQARDAHPQSIIALMNKPYTRVEAST